MRRRGRRGTARQLRAPINRLIGVCEVPFGHRPLTSDGGGAQRHAERREERAGSHRDRSAAGAVD